MKPIVLQAQMKDLLTYLKLCGDLNKNNLIEINKKVLKILTEVSENFDKIK